MEHNNIFSIDHLKGLNASWNYGKIYTSTISKALIVNKYPHLKDFVVKFQLSFEKLIILKLHRLILKWKRSIGFISMKIIKKVF